MAALEGDLLSAGGGGGGGSFRSDGRTDGRSDVRSDGSREGKDDVRTQFVTCEGTYRLMPLSEYGRPNRIQPTGSNNNTPVRVSFIKTPNNNTVKHDSADATALSKGNAATPGSANGPTGIIGSTINRPSSSTGGASSSIANGGIYVGWGGASSIGSPNGTNDFGGGGTGGGWSTNSDIGGGVTATRLNGVQTTSWNNGVGGGSAGNGGTSRTWNGGGGSVGVNDALSTEDKVCFNVGKELYVYHYNGVHKSVDLSRPIDKRLYRGTSPTCHDFNSVTCQLDRAMLVVGFTAGQVQLIDPIGKEISRLYNEERHIDKTRVTCIRWLPDSPNQFLVSHVSGQLYVYHEDLSCGTAPPVYQLFKSGEGFSVHTCKTKSTRNPLFRWVIDGTPSINEFAFSPCSRYLALVCGDGFLRVYNYDRLELVGTMKSYFGGLLCVAWSPDGRYIATGGEDDLVTVWSFVEQRVVCRGRGHTSWVNVVAFDPFTTIAPVVAVGSEEFDLSGSDEEMTRKSSNLSVTAPMVAVSIVSTENGVQSDSGVASIAGVEPNVSSYRFGSVGQDTVLCLWDLTEDLLRQPSLSRQARVSAALSDVSTSLSTSATASTNSSAFSNHCVVTGATTTSTTVASDSNGRHDSSVGTSSSATSSATSLSRKYASLSLNERDAAAISVKHRHSHSVSAKSESSKLSVKSTMASLTSSDTSSASSPASSAKLSSASEAARLLGTVSCPGLHEVPLLEPLTCKKIAHERLSALVFRQDCFVTACQEGNVYTWSRPAAWASGNVVPSTDPGGS